MTAKPEISSLPPEEIILRAERALHHGGDTHEWSDVVDGLRDGRFQCFWNDGGIIITEIYVYPKKRALHCFVVAGAMDAVLALQPKLVDFAKKQNCSVMTATGRIGWERVLPRQGWRKMHSVMALEV